MNLLHVNKSKMSYSGYKISALQNQQFNCMVLFGTLVRVHWHVVKPRQQASKMSTRKVSMLILLSFYRGGTGRLIAECLAFIWKVSLVIGQPT